MPIDQALEITRLTAKALEYAHQHHLIHRDVKPENIMLGDNNLVKLADLGIAKTFEEASAEGKPKRIVGTPHYMAPEAAIGDPIDHRIDIYSLGATLYHLLAGRTPFKGGSATEVLRSHVKEDPPPLSEFVSGIPREVVKLCEHMMAKRRDDRIDSMVDVVDAIEDLQQSLDLQADRPGGETVMLRRFASGEAADGEATTGAKTGTGSGSGAKTAAKTGSGTANPPQSTTGGRRNQPAARERRATNRRNQPPAAAVWGVRIAVVAVVGIIALVAHRPIISFLKSQGLLGGNEPTEPTEPTGPTEAERAAERERARCRRGRRARAHYGRA